MTNDNLKMITRVLFLVLGASLLITLGFDLFGFGIPDGLVTLNLILLGVTLTVAIVSQHMAVFVVRRLGQAVVSLAVIATLSFVLLRMIPGGPFDQEKALPPEIKANIEAKYGLGDPLPVQYLNFMKNLAQGDLGQSYKYIGRSVTDIISDALPVSFKLGLYALIVSIVLGVPLGLYAAARHNRAADTVSMLIAISGVSLPSFVAAGVAIQIFCYGWPLTIFAPDVAERMVQNHWLLPTGLWESPLHYILPVFILGLRPAAVIARLTRASALEVTRSDFVRTARAKGLSERVVLFKHVLRNSVIPVLTFLGPLIAGLISGAFVIETVFAVPGLGKHFIQSAFNRDYPLVMGLTLMFSTLLISANLFVDICYRIVDPRIEVA